MDDELIFATEDEEPKSPLSDAKPWKICIADDEKEVHTITKLVLEDLQFEGRPIEFISTYNGEQTEQVITKHPDIAIILLDVVMENEDTGLKLIKYIREEKKNHFIRIILRTGQPGQAPERKVIEEYDINDYNEKSELTSQKLYTVILSSLRGYRDIITIEKNRQGLEEIIKATANLFQFQSLSRLAKGILLELTSLLHLHDNSLYLQSSALTATSGKDDFKIIAATGEFSEWVDKSMQESLPDYIQQKLKQALKEKRSIFYPDAFVGYFKTSGKSTNLIYLKPQGSLQSLEKELIKIFSSNISVAFDNNYLNQDIIDTQKEVIFTLGAIVDNRSHETAAHVHRIATIVKKLALKVGLEEEEAALLKLAAPMHDIGKIGLPDNILNKPGQYSEEDYKIIKKHPYIGYNILKGSKREIMKAAAVIALQHHERWDGRGYPEGLSGENIHLYARLTAIADVFDALSHKRIYKDAWPQEQVIALMKNERGKHFDPHLIDLFLEDFQTYQDIIKTFPEPTEEEAAAEDTTE